MNNSSMMPMTTLKRQNSTVEEEAETLEADAMNILIGLNKSPPTSLDFVDCNKAAVAQPTMDSGSSSIDQPSGSSNGGMLQDDDANYQIVVEDGQRSLRPRTRKPSARAAEAALMADSYTSLDIGTRPTSRGRATSKDSSIVSTSSSSTAAAAVGGNSSSEAAEIAKKKKPMRPLTAYHIFFQLEREYIIQTTNVDNDDTKKPPTSTQDTNTSTSSTKYYHKNVPPKYRNILLSYDWYYGPGKRQKRKHRKSHGKIGFLELSKVISKQWSTLEQNDIETKQFVNDIAKQELDEYKVDIMKWKEMYGDVLDNNVNDKKKKSKKKVGGGGGKKRKIESSPKRKRAVKISDSGDKG